MLTAFQLSEPSVIHVWLKYVACCYLCVNSWCLEYGDFVVNRCFGTVRDLF